MLVYGDAERLVDPRAERDRVGALLREARAHPAGIDRHAALVTAFIAAAALLQGLADAHSEAGGGDGLTSGRLGLAALMPLARAIDRSWCAGFTDGADVDPAMFDAVAVKSEFVRLRRAEGYAFYALYPESFAEAARRSGLPPATRVIGVRSIGTGLAAMVAAALGAEAPVTVRPMGDPFRREIRVDQDLARLILSDPEAPMAVVDEGPGLSGSSFGAVFDWLETHGVKRSRLHAFPSHGGDPGPEASEAHRTRWRDIARHHVPFEDLLLHPGRREQALASWVAEMVGPLDEPLRDLSGGAWRSEQRRTVWPAANVQQERRKFLARSDRRTFVAKFAGLGGEASRKLALAQALSPFVPPVMGEIHGFLIETWLASAAPLDLAAVDRAALLRRIGHYLGARARLPADAAAGAWLADLSRMAVRNASLALGEGQGQLLAAKLGDPQPLEPLVRRVVTDNRLHRHEWLVTADGRILKADALDHAAAHDLVGCQDIAWDLAGAVAEFDLSGTEAAVMAARVARESGWPLEPPLLAFYTPCYLAFQLGAAELAAQAVGGAEADRLRVEAGRYRGRLAAWIASA